MKDYKNFDSFIEDLKQFQDAEGNVDFDGLGEFMTDSDIRELLKVSRFDLKNPPPRPEPLILLGDEIVSTPGNLTIFTGHSKTGKSAVFSALMAGMIQENKLIEVDSLGFDVRTNKEKKAVLFVDTEQSRFDWWRHGERTFRRSRMDELPDYFASYFFRQLMPEQRMKALEAALEVEAKKFGGIYAIIVDGIADFVEDPNDGGAFSVVARFETLAIKYDCPVITTIHLNPGEAQKMRGHLGSHLERKSESVFLLQKDEEKDLITIESKLTRNAGISRIIEFGWDSKQGWHVFKGYINSKPGKKDIGQYTADEMVEALDRIFDEDNELSGGELKESISEVFGFKKNTKVSEVRRNLVKLGWIKTNGENERSPKLRYYPGPNFFSTVKNQSS